MAGRLSDAQIGEFGYRNLSRSRSDEILNFVDKIVQWSSWKHVQSETRFWEELASLELSGRGLTQTVLSRKT